LLEVNAIFFLDIPDLSLVCIGCVLVAGMVGMVRGEREVDNGNGSVMGNIEASDSKGIEVWDG
jgi:hypothetical protein